MPPTEDDDLSLLRAAGRAAALRRHGRLAEAEGIYARILRVSPGHFDALHALGMMRLREERREEARTLLARALATKPDSARTLEGLGDVLNDLRHYDLAIVHYEKALAVEPESARVLNKLGKALLGANRNDEALACYERALILAPDSIEILNNQGVALERFDRHADALASFERALQIRPDSAELHFNCGVSLGTLRRYRDAITHYMRALNMRPDYIEALINLGNSLRALNRYADALAYYDRALALRPDAPEALNCRGAALHYLNRHVEALADFEKALRTRPGSAEIHWNASLSRLWLGDFQNGWREYEWRWKKKGFTTPARDFPAPLWLGKESLEGRTILLHAEQGLGDTIQFVRYAPLVARAGARVILEVQTPLKSLVQTLPGVERVVGQGEELPGFDLHCPLLSLPLAFGTTPENIPADVPYLVAAEDRIVEWRARLGPGKCPRVGLVWAGNPTPRNRSVPLDILKQCLCVSGYEFFSLQKDLSPGDAEILKSCSVRRVTEQLRDFSDTAAVVSLMDLIISVDTATLHVAGALGKPVWCLLPFAADWRWPLDRDDSPWYPTARVFRQPAFGDWDAAIQQVARGLPRFRDDIGTRPA